MTPNNILVANIGSTSFKFRLIEMPSERVLAKGGIERIGSTESTYKYQVGNDAEQKGFAALPDHSAAISLVEKALGGFNGLAAVGFKPVMARGISGTQVLAEPVLRAMEEINTLLPAHNPPYVAAVRSFHKSHPSLPCIGTFETAFYDDVPPENIRYPVPREWETKYGIRRYGFHGASHRFVSQRCAELRGTDKLRVISCHLGGSSSIAAVRDGKAIDSSWGMTPQSGLPQNNRVGDILDAAANGSADAQIALDVFVGAIRKYIGQFLVELNGADVLIFTAGIAENNPVLREKICANLDFCGLELDHEANDRVRADEAIISTPRSKIEVRVIPTNEEIIIARNAWAKLSTLN